MSDVKPTLAFAEFSDLCRGSIGYSHHMVALFDECDDVKHLRHPISFIQAVNRLKKTIKRLFERLETDKKKYVAEYEIGTYCWNSKVGKTIDPMKPPTLPVVIRNQCDGMIMIACITNELIPKAIKEQKREDSRMDPLVYAHGLTHAIIQHFTFNSPDCRLRNNLYEHNMKKQPIVEAVAIYVTYKFRQESTDKLLNVEEEQAGHDSLVGVSLCNVYSIMRHSKIPQWQERTGIKRPADSSPSTSTPIKKVHFKAGGQEVANSETSMTTFTSENGKSTSTITSLQFSADSQVPSVSSTLQETTVHIGSQPQREPPKATDTTPKKQVTQQKGPKSERKTMKKITRDEKILILNCYNQLNVKNNYDVLAEKVYAKREECLSRDLVQHYEKNLDVSTTLKSRIKSYIQRVQRGKDNETDLDVKDLISRSGLIISRNDNASAESNEPQT